MATTEKARMLAGELYDAKDAELVAARHRVRRLVRAYNDSDPADAEGREALLRRILGGCGEDVQIEPPVQFDYGFNVTIGRNVFVNFNCVLLDCAPIRIGDGVLLGPGVQLYTATHPLDAAVRAAGLESARPIVIEDDVWTGGGTIVNPGVTIGRGSTIGAGSVVTRDVPPGVFAAGNPCRVIRVLDPQESRSASAASVTASTGTVSTTPTRK